MSIIWPGDLDRLEVPFIRGEIYELKKSEYGNHSVCCPFAGWSPGDISEVTQIPLAFQSFLFISFFSMLDPTKCVCLFDNILSPESMISRVLATRTARSHLVTQQRHIFIGKNKKGIVYCWMGFDSNGDHPFSKVPAPPLKMSPFEKRGGTPHF